MKKQDSISYEKCINDYIKEYFRISFTCVATSFNEQDLTKTLWKTYDQLSNKLSMKFIDINLLHEINIILNLKKMRSYEQE